MAEVIWTEKAYQQFRSITEYIALDNSVAANRFAKKVDTHVKRLEEFPKLGKARNISGSSFRELVIPPCRIFYRIAKESVYIITVYREEKRLTGF